MQKRVGNSLRRSGFTVVELLIVIVVIAILAAITVVAYNGVRERSMTVKQLADLNAYIKIIEAYKINKGPYPPSTMS